MSVAEKIEGKDIHKRIREAAEEEFARRGYHRAVVDDIAERAQVGKGTVYRHYGDKRHLFLEIMCHGAARLVRRIEEKDFPAGNIEKNLWKLAAVQLDLLKQSRALVALIVREGYQIDGVDQTEFFEIIMEFIALTADVFRREIQAGGLKTSHDPQTLARLFIGQLWSIVRGAIVFEESFKSVEEKFNTAVEIFLIGILKNGEINHEVDV